MKRVFLILIACLAFQIAVYAQAEKKPCPKISVATSAYPDAESPWTYTASVENQSDYPNIEYFWDTTAGKIITGQGTRTIELDVSDTGGLNVQVTVEIKGLPENCPNTFTETLAVSKSEKPKK